jgi:hypothetical protein
MPAYAIGRLQMRDPSWRAEYGPRVAELVKKMERLEGHGDLPSATVSSSPLWRRPWRGTTTRPTRR